MHRFQHAAMATRFEIRCTHPDAAYAQQAARAAFAAVDRLELLLSRFVENSDISRINHLEAGEATVVGYETMECLRLAELVHAETGGMFDVAMGTGFGRLEIVPDAFTVRLRAPACVKPEGARDAQAVQLDLGAIGKGYAVDRIAEVLEDWDVSQALIDAGYSSVLALEPPEGQSSWPLTLSDPGEGGAVLVRLAARQRALGASGIRKGDHILNPRDGAPVRARAAAWVSGSREALAGFSRLAGTSDSPAAAADALSTAFMISSLGEIEACCRAHPGVEAWILEGHLIHCPGAGPAGPGPMVEPRT